MHQRALQLRLVENMERGGKAMRLRGFIDAVAAGADGCNDEDRHKVDAWLEWARVQVNSLDPIGKAGTTSLGGVEATHLGTRRREATTIGRASC